jgi:hypothetical protein
MDERGMLTEKVQEKAKELLGIELTVLELRLMPYLQYCVMNTISLRRTSSEEMNILTEWQNKGWLTLDGGMAILTKDFWDAMHEILWIAYTNQ